MVSCSSAPKSTTVPVQESGDNDAGTSTIALQRNTDIEALISGMSTREKIAQQFISWIPPYADTQEITRLKNLKTAGYILYPHNFTDINELKTLTAILSDVPELHKTGYTIKPFLCADQEGGRVSAIRFKEFGILPSAFMLGSLQDRDLIESSAHANALQLAHLGLNMNLAPVADIYDRADETIIGDRSFGSDPQWVSEAVTAYIQGLHKGGIISTLKHFPGHGITTVDTHGSLPVVYSDLSDLREKELIPFIRGIEADVPVIMTAHILYPFIDAENPASLSYTLLTELLREELGFTGIIISDGFEMGALSKNYSKQDALCRALNAGVNIILLYYSYDPAEMISLTEDLLHSGKLTMETINNNVRRSLMVKKRYGLLLTE